MKNSTNYRPEVQKTIDQINEADAARISDEFNPAYMLQGLSSKLLAQIVTGEIDPVAVARLELAGRGQIPHANNAAGFESVSFSKADAALLDK